MVVTPVRLEAEVEPWVVLEQQASPLSISLPPDDNVGGEETFDLEIPRQLPGCPTPARARLPRLHGYPAGR